LTLILDYYQLVHQCASVVNVTLSSIVYDECIIPSGSLLYKIGIVKVL